jgi:hypothetical protein
LAALGVFVQDQPSLAALLALSTAMIPAMASYITSFRQLYNWDRQLTIYRDTQLSLESAKLLMPDLEALTPEEAHSLFPKLVQQVEGVIEKEAAQWGQIAIGKGEEEGQATAAFGKTYAAALADSSGELDQRQLDALSGILEASGSTPAAGQYRLKPDELTTDSPLLPDSFYGYSEEESRERRERAKAAAQAASQQPTAADSTQAEPPSLLPTVEENMPDDSESEASENQTESDMTNSEDSTSAG